MNLTLTSNQPTESLPADGTTLDSADDRMRSIRDIFFLTIMIGAYASPASASLCPAEDRVDDDGQLAQSRLAHSIELLVSIQAGDSFELRESIELLQSFEDPESEAAVRVELELLQSIDPVEWLESTDSHSRLHLIERHWRAMARVPARVPLAIPRAIPQGGFCTQDSAECRSAIPESAPIQIVVPSSTGNTVADINLPAPLISKCRPRYDLGQPGRDATCRIDRPPQTSSA
jgi:hypothetical protein